MKLRAISIPILTATVPVAALVLSPARADYPEWSSLVQLQTQSAPLTPFLSPVHAILLPPNGTSVLFIGRARAVASGASTVSDDRWVGTMAIDTNVPPTNPASSVTVPGMEASLANNGEPTPDGCTRYDDLFCSGHTLLSDGTVLTVGGTRNNANNSPGSCLDVTQPGPTIGGMDYAKLFTGATPWAAGGPSLVGTGTTGKKWRWYGTATRLYNKKVLVSGGLEVIESTQYNESVELYDPSTNTFSLLSKTSVTGVTGTVSPTQILSDLYTHVFQLPSTVTQGGNPYDVLMFGQAGVPLLMSPTGTTQATTWFNGAMRPGGQTNPNGTASSLLLPIRLSETWGYTNGSALIVGGNDPTSSVHADVYKPTDAWLSSIVLPTAWPNYPSTVLLPDGKVLIVNGYDPNSINPQTAQYLDPRSSPSSWVVPRTGGAMGETRGYHSVALLIPDGRVIVGGGSDNDTVGTEKATLRYFSPAYMNSASRPTLSTAPSTITAGSPTNFTITGTWAASPNLEAVLIGFGAMTHSFDMNQRYVQLAVATQGANTATVTPPSSTRLAPPGYYMLFVVNMAVSPPVPSKALVVQVL